MASSDLILTVDSSMAPALSAPLTDRLMSMAFSQTEVDTTGKPKLDSGLVL